jgi:hypothetical protein
MRSFLSAVFAAILANGVAGAETDWPQFRGPRGDGDSPAKHAPVAWSETNNLAWKVSLPGRGRSSPVVLGARIWLTLALEKGGARKRIAGDDMQTAEHVSLEAVCLDRADGKILWRAPLFDVDNPDPVHWLNSWATPTPVVEPGRLYCDFGTFGTACLNAKTGEVLWKTRLPLDHQVGPGSSPVLYQNLLVLVRDGRDAQYLAALDKRTGKQVWKTNRPPIIASSPNLKKSFATPLLVKTGGRTQLISPGAQWLVSYEPSSGKEIWRIRHGEGFSIGSGPVFRDGTVFFSTGCMRPQLWAVRADGEGDVTTTHVVWKSSELVPVMSSPILAGEEIYWVSDDGMASCSDFRSGEVHWRKRVVGKHYASPLLADGRIYFFGNDGKSTVIKAGKQFEKLAENQIEGQVTATPAILDRTIFLRTDTHLYRIGKE